MGEVRQLAELFREHRRAEPGESVWPPSIDRFERLDKSALFQARQRRIERAGPSGRPVPASTSVMIA